MGTDRQSVSRCVKIVAVDDMTDRKQLPHMLRLALCAQGAQSIASELLVKESGQRRNAEEDHMSSAATIFLILSIVIGMVFGLSTYAIAAGILMLVLVGSRMN
jgi:hypothetical protein